jgi:hypothetical protein
MTKIAKNKHTSLLLPVIHYEENEFYEYGVLEQFGLDS